MSDFWKKTHQTISASGKAVLLYVLQSSGSSPGRQGFRMCVAPGGVMFGSIGGGIMEHKLVELARELLQKKAFSPFVKPQIHKPDAEKNRSGMICDGEQWVAFYYLDESTLPEISRLSEGQSKTLSLTHERIFASDADASKQRYSLLELTEQKWHFEEQTQTRPSAYIFGGGHVGLAMCEMMKKLGFRVVNLDDRPDLNSMQENRFADEKLIIDYQKSDQFIPESPDSYVIIMSFGYKPDEVILRRLIGRNFAYLGMMGSRNKVDTMFQKLRKDGFSDADLKKIHAPIGLPINSKTPAEIAVSIAAEVIKVKNEG